jgi:hypothetical protein
MKHQGISLSFSPTSDSRPQRRCPFPDQMVFWASLTCSKTANNATKGRAPFCSYNPCCHHSPSNASAITKPTDRRRLDLSKAAVTVLCWLPANKIKEGTYGRWRRRVVPPQRNIRLVVSTGLHLGRRDMGDASIVCQDKKI